jgi:hypothetical protein
MFDGLFGEATDRSWKLDLMPTSVREVGRQLAAVCGDLGHHLLVQPDIDAESLLIFD